MKDTKSLAWLLPVAGLLVLFGWFLGRAGWNFSKLNVGIGELEPPTATVGSSPTPRPTVTAIPTSRPPTSIPFIVDWLQEISQVPESETQLSWSLSAGQVFYLSGGQFQIGEIFCGGDASQICVLIYQTTVERTITINALIPRHNYVGITETLTPEEILEEKRPLF